MKTSHDYQSFQKRRTKIVGVWDDHDYGVNDGGASDEVYTASVQVQLINLAAVQVQCPMILPVVQVLEL